MTNAKQKDLATEIFDCIVSGGTVHTFFDNKNRTSDNIEQALIYNKGIVNHEHDDVVGTNLENDLETRLYDHEKFPGRNPLTYRNY